MGAGTLLGEDRALRVPVLLGKPAGVVDGHLAQGIPFHRPQDGLAGVGIPCQAGLPVLTKKGSLGSPVVGWTSKAMTMTSLLHQRHPAPLKSGHGVAVVKHLPPPS